jgi:uncharacterized membrane protein HdeD (DUF308 family)
MAKNVPKKKLANLGLVLIILGLLCLIFGVITYYFPGIECPDICVTGQPCPMPCFNPMASVAALSIIVGLILIIAGVVSKLMTKKH